MMIEKFTFDMQKNFKIAKSFDSCQAAHSAQADMSRYFSHGIKIPFHSG